MIRGKALRQILDKFINKSEVSQNARVQVCLPNGELYDINGLQLMQNKIIGNRETHRLVIRSSTLATRFQNFMKEKISCSSSLAA
jgi:hypothetical protein